MSEPTGTQYGGFWVRFLALLADSAIVFLLSTALLMGASMALGPSEMTPAVIAIWVLGFLYWPILHASRLRATFGKALLGLHVTRFDGRRIGILRGLWREIAKVFSSAVFMLGYVIAAVTPRKQALHDLMAATYVAREGVSRVFPALLVVLAGYATPIFVAPMLVDPAVMSKMEKLATDAMAHYDPMAQFDPLKPATRPATQAMKVAPRSPTPAQAPAAKATAPTPVAKAPEAPKVEPIAPKPVQVAAAPNPAPAALAQPATAPASVPEPVKPVTESVKPVTEPVKTVKQPVKPKVVTAKPKQAPAPAVVRVANRPSAATSEAMLGSGPKYNDLMTAVLAKDPAAVNELLRLGRWVDKPDSRGRTPLMVAAAQDDLPTAEALVRGGASAHPAVQVAEQRGNREMVALLRRYDR